MAWQGKDEPDSVAPWFLRDAPGFQIVSELTPMPDEAVFDKITMSAFEGTPLTLALRDCGILSFAIPEIAGGSSLRRRCDSQRHRNVYRPPETGSVDRVHARFLSSISVVC